ncbi:MAG TPA: SpoIID/LytB domain-containing protein [Planctomycetota bacterium]|nr:SpoIID/LytB domain-containing protein [Planctomycetota bacterium]
MLAAVLAIGARRESAAAPRLHLRGEDPVIPVLLTALDGASSVAFRAAGGWRARDDEGRTLAQGGATPHVLSIASARVALDGSPLPSNDVVLESADGRSIEIGARIAPATSPKTPLDASARSYRGALRVAVREPPASKAATRPASATLRVTNEVPLEAYLASVVGSEMYASSTVAAALEAQAIAARTYARWELSERGRIPLPDSVEAQAYEGAARETAATRAAVAATHGRVLTYGGELLAAFYHATCGGRTIDGSHLLHDTAPPPLRGVECGFCEKAKRYRWSVLVDRATLSRLAAEIRVGSSIRAFEGVGPKEDPWTSVRVTGDAGTVVLPARALRLSMMRSSPSYLPSPFLTEIASDPKGVAVRGRGFGHGVGMCQSGAAEMGRRGATAESILAHYYPGAVVSPAAP